MTHRKTIGLAVISCALAVLPLSGCGTVTGSSSSGRGLDVVDFTERMRAREGMPFLAGFMAPPEAVYARKLATARAERKCLRAKGFDVAPPDPFPMPREGYILDDANILRPFGPETDEDVKLARIRAMEAKAAGGDLGLVGEMERINEEFGKNREAVEALIGPREGNYSPVMVEGKKVDEVRTQGCTADADALMWGGLEEVKRERAVYRRYRGIITEYTVATRRDPDVVAAMNRRDECLSAAGVNPPPVDGQIVEQQPEPKQEQSGGKIAEEYVRCGKESGYLETANRVWAEKDRQAFAEHQNLVVEFKELNAKGQERMQRIVNGEL